MKAASMMSLSRPAVQNPLSQQLQQLISPTPRCGHSSCMDITRRASRSKASGDASDLRAVHDLLATHTPVYIDADDLEMSCFTADPTGREWFSQRAQRSRCAAQSV